jgi:ABC-type lipoprotein release transport system permease subunit
MIWSVAWRNIWRSKVRSLVILSAIALGVFSGAFIWAFYVGMVQQRINSAIKTETSHIQLHHKNYLTDPDFKYTIANADSIAGTLTKRDGVQAVSSRLLVNSMISSPRTGAGVRIIGVNPAMERQVTNLSEKLKEGEYFTGVKRNPIIIGEKLAEKLKVKLRSQVFVTLQQADGTIVKDAFKVAGIFSTGNTGYDEANVFVRTDDLAAKMDMSNASSHEIAVLLNSDEFTNTQVAKLQKLFPSLDVKSWRDLMPEVSLVEDTMDISMIIFICIILLGLLFGIINTMLMSVLERIKELGMLMSVGMNKFRVFGMIMLETIMLSLTGGIVGIFFSIIISVITKRTGIDLSAWSDAYARLGYDSIVYPVMHAKIIFEVTLMVIITGILGALYPAYKALKLNPADAIRINM